MTKYTTFILYISFHKITSSLLTSTESESILFNETSSDLFFNYTRRYFGPPVILELECLAQCISSEEECIAVEIDTNSKQISCVPYVIDASQDSLYSKKNTNTLFRRTGFSQAFPSTLGDSIEGISYGFALDNTGINIFPQIRVVKTSVLTGFKYISYNIGTAVAQVWHQVEDKTYKLLWQHKIDPPTVTHQVVTQMLPNDVTYVLKEGDVFGIHVLNDEPNVRIKYAKSSGGTAPYALKENVVDSDVQIGYVMTLKRTLATKIPAFQAITVDF